MPSIYFRTPLAQPFISMDEIFRPRLSSSILFNDLFPTRTRQPAVKIHFTSSPSVLTLAEYIEIRALKKEPLSILIEKYGLDRITAVFSKDRLIQKFEAEFAELPPAELLKKYDLPTLHTWNRAGIVSDEKMDKLKAFRKEEIRADAAPFSQLFKTYGLANLKDAFSLAELSEKFNAECQGKSEKEVFAEIDLDFLLSSLGRTLIDDRFKDAFKDGVVRIEKEGTVREIYLSDSLCIARETKTEKTADRFEKI